MSIEVRNLTKKFGNQIAVNDVSFTCEKGKITGFLGPNGAGKSTTMKMIMGFLKKNDGTIRVNGVEVQESDISYRKKIGYLPEHNPLYLEMYVKEFLLFVANVNKLKNKKDRVAELIKLTGLEKEQNKKISQLSKGYRQRVGLAQAMIHDPEVLILDEPTSGLDPNQLVEIRKLIKELGKEKTVVFSTHIMQEVQALCDQVIIIDQGNILVNDKIENLENYVSGDQLYEVEFEKNIPISELEKESFIANVEALAPNRFRLSARKNKDIRAEIFDFAVKTKNRIIEVRKEKSSIEDVFQVLTNKKKG